MEVVGVEISKSGASMTLYIELDGGSQCLVQQEGDTIEGKVLLEDYVGIVNTGTFEDSGNRYNVCQTTGFKVRPRELVRQWDGAKVRPESFDVRNEQDNVRVHAEELTGPIRPEAEDVFVSTSTAPEDL